MYFRYSVCFGLFFLGSALGADILKILPSKEQQTKFVGDAFFVGCESSGRNVQRVMWTGPDRKQITSNLERIHVEDGKSGHKGVDLVFENIERRDRGRYTCSANVDGKEVEKSFQLNVFRPINFENTEKEQFLEEGSDSPIRCNVEGDPKPRVTWRYKGQVIKIDSKTPGAKYTHHPENPFWIVVKNATIKDGGPYKCVAIQLTTTTSEVKKQQIQVKVRHRPLGASEHMNESYSYVTGVVNLTCEVIAEPSANFTWIKEGVVIHAGQNAKIYNEDQKSVLQLTVVDEKMFGDYYCKAQNRLGTLERVVSLEKGIKPSVPQVKVKKVKENVFYFNLTSKGTTEMPIIGYRVEYKRPGEDWSDATSREFKRGKSYILDGLKHDTLYVMRVSSKNIAGYSDPSKDLMERTKKVSPKTAKVSGTSPLAAVTFLPFFMFLLSLTHSSSIAS